MRYVLPVLLTSSTLAMAHAPVHAADKLPTEAQVEFFEKKIRPIFAIHCQKCHGPKKQEGKLRLDSKSGLEQGGESGPIVKPGHPDQSELIAAINYGADSFQMPPDGKLKPAQIDLLTQWVKMGAPWPGTTQAGPATTSSKTFNLNERAKHWSFQPIQQPNVPSVKHTDWSRNPVDQFILARLEDSGMTPAPPTDRRTLLRRLSYDLTGLPPSIAELQEFLNDTSPGAFERQVDRLLASTRYGERWARHWLDLVRFAETGGHEFDYEIPHVWPYRDYVIRAFNQDVPYNQFVIEHIAGDLLKSPRRRPANGDNESVVGTAFYWFCQGKHSPVDIRAEECDAIDNQIDVFGKTFLGLTIACARCHDHKFDPIRANDYYALAGYLQSSRRQLAILNDSPQMQDAVNHIAASKRENRDAFEKAEAVHLLAHMPRLQALMLEFDEIEPKQREAWQKYLKNVAAKDLIDLFHAWAVLHKKTNPAEFTAARKGLLNRLQQQSMAAANLPTSSLPFGNNNFGDWYVSGNAFGQAPTTVADQVWHEIAAADGSVVRELTQSGRVHSGLLSERLQGTLRSPTFTIEKRYVYYRARRWGGRPNPGRAVKNGQLHLIVDGFQYIKSPLYGGLTINVPNDDRFRWHRHDLSKFKGRRAYLEIVDEDDGAIVVDRILFSDSDRLPDTPIQLVLNLLDDPALTSAQQLAKRYQQLFEETLTTWKQGQLKSTPDADPRIAQAAADQIEIINSLLRQRRLITPAKPSAVYDPKLASSVNQHRTLCRELVASPRRSVAMIDGSPENEHLLIRGNHTKPGPEVPRRFLEVLHDPAQPTPQSDSGRLQLARQVASPDNPLTARVLVNRLWQHHFGRGIVASPDNFGLQGSPPSHPQLLDWLAREFINSGWSIKHMHRLMLTSNTYRMSSRSTDPQAEQRDPSNILLHRMNIKRLEGEAIRDGLLAISGRLDERKFGPGVLPHLSPFMEGRGRPGSGPLDGDGRRSIYINVRRNFLTPLFLAFDLPSPSTTIGRRSVSNVPAQALTLMNNPFIIQQATLWANRTLNETEASGGRQPADSAELIRQRIERLYETAFSRPPTPAELTAANSFLKEQGKEYNGPNDPRTWADLCHVLLNVKEFVFVN